MSQQKLQFALSALNAAMQETGMQSEYWTAALEKASRVTLKPIAKGGVIQGNFSNPVAYFVVPLYGDGTRGRSHDFTIKQFQFAVIKGWESDADKRLRGIDPDAINAGLASNRARSDSSFGSLAGRQAAQTASNLASKGGKVGSIAKELTQAEQEGIFKEEWSATLAVEDLKRRLAAVKVPKVKPEAKPEVTKKEFEAMQAKDKARDIMLQINYDLEPEVPEVKTRKGRK